MAVRAGVDVQYHNSEPPARLKRFVSDLDPTFAAKFDVEKNLLRINSTFYLGLSKRQQERVWRAQGDMTVREARA
jgi:hypothetical protein